MTGTRAPFAERLSRGLTEQPDGCLVWTGYKLKGYGRINRDGKIVYTHRAAWEEANGPIPAGMEIDHLCRNPACANVGHLEVVASSTNLEREATANRRSSCPQGHPLDGVLTRRSGRHAGRTERYCLTCNRERVRKRR